MKNFATNDFATILTRLEEASCTVERAGADTLASLLGVFARFDAQTPKPADEDRTSLASRIYGVGSEPARPVAARKGDEHRGQERKGEEGVQRLPDREEFFGELRRAEGSPSELRALRRRVAWLCHPDRREKAGARQAERLLAEFNAQIDAAVARAGHNSRRASAPRR
jgi:hypothetical protein